MQTLRLSCCVSCTPMCACPASSSPQGSGCPSPCSFSCWCLGRAAASAAADLRVRLAEREACLWDTFKPPWVIPAEFRPGREEASLEAVDQLLALILALEPTGGSSCCPGSA